MEKICVDDVEIDFLYYDTSAKIAVFFLNKSRKKKVKEGIICLKTTWRFLVYRIQKILKKVRTIIATKMDIGQIIHVLQDYWIANCKVTPSSKIGGKNHHSKEFINFSTNGGY
jgi:pyruvate/2-oxoacid:ferredoxin oxidoreductase alpha subunit